MAVLMPAVCGRKSGSFAPPLQHHLTSPALGWRGIALTHSCRTSFNEKRGSICALPIRSQQVSILTKGPPFWDGPFVVGQAAAAMTAQLSAHR